MQQLEQEVKLEVDPGWSVPDLSGLFPGLRAVALPPLALETVYYDTADGRLAKHHIALRYRLEVMAGVAGAGTGQGTAVWTIKLPSSAPSDGTVLVRTELTWPVPVPAGQDAVGTAARPRPGRRRPAPTHPLRPHPEAAQFLRAVTLGLPLAPVAHLTTTRERTELRTSDGRQLAEIDHDDVSGRSLVPAREGPAGTATGPDGVPTVHFVEVEVELAEGSAQEVLEAVAARLRLAGARSSSRQSKLSTVLSMAAQAATGAVDERPDGPASRARRSQALMSDVVAEQARSCLGTLLDHDPAIRLGDPDPEHVHQARVGARRLRSVLGSFAPLVDNAGPELDDSPQTWWSGRRDELKWLGGALGEVRDADVRLQGLLTECSTLPTAYHLGTVALLAAAEDDQRLAHDALLADMASERYIELLRSLELLASGSGALPVQIPTGLWALLAQPAATGMPALALRQWRAVRQAVHRLGDQPPDAALHRVRIQAKRLRYLAEVAAPFVAPAAHRESAKRTAKAAAALQDVLGQLHDAAVSEQWLREGSDRVPGRAKSAVVFATGLVAGQLVARAQERQRALRKKWPAAWAPLQSRQLHCWVEP